MATPSVQTPDNGLAPVCSFADALNDPVIITTADLDRPGPNIVYVNPAFSRVTGYSAAESVGRSPRFLQGDGTDRTVLASLRRTLDSGQSFFGRILNYTKSGQPLIFEWYISPWHDARGILTHWISVQRAVESGAATGRGFRVTLVGVEPAEAERLRRAFHAVDRRAEIRHASDPAAIDANPPGDLLVFQTGGHDAAAAEILRRIRRRHPDTSVIAYLPEADVELMRSLMLGGARALIAATTEDRVLPEIVRVVLAGGMYVPWRPTFADAPTEPPTAEAAAATRLTRRQKEILRLIGEGLSNAEIAAALGLKQDTVKGHVSRLLRALGLKNRTQAALLVSQHSAAKRRGVGATADPE